GVVVGPRAAVISGTPQPTIVAYDQPAARPRQGLLVNVDAVLRIARPADLRPGRAVELPERHAGCVKDVGIRGIDEQRVIVVALRLDTHGVLRSNTPSTVPMQSSAIIGSAYVDSPPGGDRVPGVGRLPEAQQLVVMTNRHLVYRILDAHVEHV